MRSSLRLLCLAWLTTCVVSCGPKPPVLTCRQDSECGAGQLCTEGACVAAPLSECAAGETRACGNDAVGACRRGTQRCVNGAFETACAGEVKPAVELCNQVDDDCDGEVDEGLSMAWYPDADGDGFGAASAPARMACAQPAGFVADASDCNDAAASVHPGGAEVCDGPGLDEDCDGTANEGCACANVGAAQPCCSGRGTQTCQAGGTLSACSASVSVEVCNNVDDDCDGQVDDAPQFVTDAGAPLTCTVGLGACSRVGAPTCSNFGMVSCVGDAGLPSSELCNGLDDDCNGLTDDAALLAQADGGVLALDGGVASSDGSCTVGVGACARTGQTSCVAGALACSEVPGAPQAGVCNQQDDDCDGTVDEPGDDACPATGQTCLNGTCGCPSGQSVCNGACVTLSAEVCDGVDNDCDGQTDEGVTQACLADGDGDLYATNATVVQRCGDAARPAAGFCPVGFVAPGSSLGLDCSAADAAAYRLVSSRTDADGDTACVAAAQNDCVGVNALPGRRFATACNLVDDCNDGNPSLYRLVSSRTDADLDASCAGPAADDCVGTSALPGRRFASSCNATDDCNDGSASLYRLVSSRTDADGDTTCVGVASNDCVGATALPGRRFTSACAATDDCNDANTSLYRLMNTRADGDADGYCSGAVVSECSGTSPNPGRRFEPNCLLPDDCNDANASVFRNASVRVDFDNDQWCAGAAQTMCIGNAPPSGYRLSANCQGDDCRDTNAQATSVCTLTNAYTTTYHAQTCPQGRTNFTVTTLTFCPIGFILGAMRPDVSSGGGFCEVVNQSTIAQTCNFLEGTNCRIVGDCVAQ